LGRIDLPSGRQRAPFGKGGCEGLLLVAIVAKAVMTARGARKTW
jgi:hypothetical protein